MKYFIILFIFLTFCTKETPVQSNVLCECKNPLIDSVAIVTCIQVVDGDTWKFAIGDDIFSVRVLGIDCYETKHNDRLRQQAEKAGISEDSAYTLGQMAKHLADSLMSGKEIKMVRDFQEDNFDTYNRLLRIIYLPDGRSLENILLNSNLALAN